LLPGKEGLLQDRLRSPEAFLRLVPKKVPEKPAYFTIFYSFFEKENKGDIGTPHCDVREIPFHVRKGLEEKFLFHWTRLGVVCATLHLEEKTPLGGTLHLNGDENPTDVSGLKIRVDLREGKRKLAEIAPVFQQLAFQLREHQPRTTLHFPITRSKTAAPGTVAAMITGAGFGVAKHLLLHPYGLVAVGVAGVIGTFATSPLKRDSVHQINAILIALKRFCEHHLPTA
jgi:hypothetical protein